jgi:uncharacterized protein YqgC (DUF456 family)
VVAVDIGSVMRYLTRPMGKRAVYGLAGFASGALIGWVIGRFFHVRAIWQLGLFTGPLLVWWAERRGKVQAIDRLTRPTTLFPPEDPKA